MIQRFLHGRLFYIIFGALVMSLYVKTLGMGSLESITSSQSLHVEEAPTDASSWRFESPEPSQLPQVAMSHRRLTVMFAVLLLLVTGLFVGGVLVAWWAVTTDGIRSVWRFPVTLRSRWSFGELGRITFLAVAVAFLMPFVRLAILSVHPAWSLDQNLWVTASMLLLDVLMVIAILAFAEDKTRPAWAAFGVSPRGVARSMKSGLLGYLAIFPWLCGLLVLIMQVSRLLGLEPSVEPIHRLIFQERRLPVLVLTAVLACLIGPIAEEFFFRGVVYAALRQRSSRLIAMLVSAVLFSLIHTNVVGFVPILLLGMLLAYLYERTGSLIAPMTVHILHNTLLLSLAMIFRQLAPFSG